MTVTESFTDEELAAIREERNRRNREWWARMSAEERKAKRRQYDLRSATRRRQKTGKPVTR